MTSKEASLTLTCRVRPRAAIGRKGTSEQEFCTSESECEDRLSHSELRSHHVLLVTRDEDPMDKEPSGRPGPLADSHKPQDFRVRWACWRES